MTLKHVSNLIICHTNYQTIEYNSPSTCPKIGIAVSAQANRGKNSNANASTMIAGQRTI